MARCNGLASLYDTMVNSSATRAAMEKAGYQVENAGEMTAEEATANLEPPTRPDPDTPAQQAAQEQEKQDNKAASKLQEIWEKYNKWIIGGGLLLTVGGVYLITRNTSKKRR